MPAKDQTPCVKASIKCLESLKNFDAKKPVAADLRAALQRTVTSWKDVQVTSSDFQDVKDAGYVDKASPNVNGFQESSVVPTDICVGNSIKAWRTSNFCP